MPTSAKPFASITWRDAVLSDGRDGREPAQAEALAGVADGEGDGRGHAPRPRASGCVQ